MIFYERKKKKQNLHKVFIILLLFFFFLPSIIYSQVNSPPYIPPGYQIKPKTDLFSYDAGINQYNKDTFLYINPTFNFTSSNWGLGFQLPLNILMLDKDPKYDNSKLGMLRPGDYDSKTDYQRLLNYVWLGNYGYYEPTKVTYSVYLGKMFDGYIGHGTIVNRYVNNLTIDNYKLGVMADVNTDWGGVQVFTNSIYDRDVNAARVYIRPYGSFLGLYRLFTGADIPAFMMPGNVMDTVGRKKIYQEAEDYKPETRTVIERDEKGKLVERQVPVSLPQKEKPASQYGYDSIWNRFAIGITNAFDSKAPNQLDYDTTGQVRYDSTNNLKVKTQSRLSIQGVDMEWKVVNKTWLEVTPYVDVNQIKNFENAKGRHYGIFMKWGSQNVKVILKPEYRSMNKNYIPMYFDSFYEVERYQTNLNTDMPYTKYQYNANIDTAQSTINGYYHTAVVTVYNIGFEVNYEDYQGANNSRVFAGLYVPIKNLIRISGFYNKKGFDKMNESFKLDDRSMGVAEIALNLSVVTLKLQNRRRWIFDSTVNQYTSVDEQMFLVSGGTSF